MKAFNRFVYFLTSFLVLGPPLEAHDVITITLYLQIEDMYDHLSGVVDAAEDG